MTQELHKHKTSAISHSSQKSHITDLSTLPNTKHPLEETDSFIKLRQKLGCCTRFVIFLYNNENKTVMNRNRTHWGDIILYYIIFLFTVITFFTILFYITRRFMTTDNDSEPVVLKTSKLTYPLITYVPLTVNKVSEPLIWFGHTGDDTDTNRRGISYVKAMSEYLKLEEQKCIVYKIEDCPIQRTDYGDCGKESYGYDVKQPCIFIKMTQLDGWGPSSFRKAKNLPRHIPKEMKQVIEIKREAAWVYCAGSTSYDKEHLGNITYIPKQYFDDQFFPMKKGINPIIAIQLKELQAGYVLKMTCELLGGNILEKVVAHLNIFMQL